MISSFERGRDRSSEAIYSGEMVSEAFFKLDFLGIRDSHLGHAG